MVCLDTSFLIDILKGNQKVEELEHELEDNNKDINITSLSIMELIKGIKLRENLPYVKETEKEKINDILSNFNILGFDKNSAILAGEIEADLINKGEIIDIEDIMIAAITINNDEILLTRNRKHFEKIKGLKIESY